MQGVLLHREADLYLRGSRTIGETSENHRFDAGRFRGGWGYGSGSGSVIWERRKREKAFGSASGIRRTINATLSPFKSFRQITPSHRRHIPVRRERRIKGAVFCAHPIGRSPQSNAGFRKAGERGASAEKQEFFPPPRKAHQRGGFLRASDRKVPAGKCRISKRG